jgi:dTDP-4-amino-4,6-dideoxy-D-glucose acyltransferase
MPWLKDNELSAMGFPFIGNHVQISDKASFHNCAGITIGHNVRIDDFCVLSAGVGGIFLGDFVHLAGYSLLMGTGRIVLNDFSGLSSRVAIYSSNDDYSGKTMTNPTVPLEFSGVTHADVILEKHVIVGSGSVILPGVTLHEGAAVGALSLVNSDCDAFGIYAGVPAIFVKERSRNLLVLEKKIRDQSR